MKVAAVQHDVVWEDPEANFARLAPMIAQAAGAGARLVILSEMFATGFSLSAERGTEPVNGWSTRFLMGEAATHGVWVCGSLTERLQGQGRPFNRLVLVGPDGRVERYTKIHLFTYAGEHERFAAGSEHLTVDIEGVRVSTFVCYDLRFADDFWAVADATDLYVVVANWPASRRTHWQVLLQARAIENQAYVAGVNRVGSGGGLVYAGDSRLITPMGEVLITAAETEAVLIAEVNPDLVAATRQHFPFLIDRRR